MNLTLGRIGREIGAAVPAGSEDVEIAGVASIKDAVTGDICFLSNPRYARYLDTTGASAVIVGRGTEVPAGIVGIEVDDPYFAFLRLLELFNTRSPSDIADGIHELAVIEPGARLGKNVSIGAFAVIGARATVGDGTIIGSGTVVMPRSSIGAKCILYPNVTVMDGCEIGDRVIIHAGAVIGADGFGFAPSGGSIHKIPQIGSVRIEDDVEIGACTCIDRAAFGVTVIGKSAKLDNLIQVAHNVQVGSHTVIASQVGISGSTVIGSGVQMGGQAGLSGHLAVGDGSSVGAQAGVTKDVPPGETVSGYPAKNHMKAMRLEAALRNLPELAKTVRKQQKRIEELERIIEKRSE